MKRAATVALAFAALVAAWVAASGQVNQCSSGYVTFLSDSGTPVCIKFHTEEKGSWSTMRALCQLDQTDLAELRGDLHHQVYQYITLNKDLQDKDYWIGGTDEGHEGEWTWVSDDSAMEMGTPHWYPCDDQPHVDTKSNYACVKKHGYYFYSCHEDNQLYAICQI
ncbi:uncharacterized protein [Procambarus clarkii]|uniref:uncharacterized protein n=1 Tax=Procambarus clarkii TaxID=6728 RepID=UPI001E670732|nr:uncharacterized protein LOC123774638 [Procambarus clarkii]